MRIVDLRTDTITLPTEEMREAMRYAEVGDDVYGEDPTVKRLEELAARTLGKEAALFLVSGTMGNQVAALTHCYRGDEIIVEQDAHIYNYEVGALAALGGIQVRTVKGHLGVLDPADVEMAIQPDNIHYAKTRLLCVENTHNRSGGTVLPLDNLKALRKLADKYGLNIHMDGARIFNAAVALGVDVKEIAQYPDSIMFCLSKGLAAPVGSMLVGRKEWIERARRYRKMLGGGMRQAGVIAAAGIVALEKMVGRLTEDHTNAQILAKGLAEMGCFEIDLATVQTNMVNFGVSPLGMSVDEFLTKIAQYGVKGSASGPVRVRLVTHYGITEDDITYALDAIKQAIGR